MIYLTPNEISTLALVTSGVSYHPVIRNPGGVITFLRTIVNEINDPPTGFGVTIFKRTKLS